MRPLQSAPRSDKSHSQPQRTLPAASARRQVTRLPPDHPGEHQLLVGTRLAAPIPTSSMELHQPGQDQGIRSA